MSSLFLYCRPGFENEAAAEIQEKAQQLGMLGFVKAKPDAAYLVFQPHDPAHAVELHRAVRFDSLIFTRQWFVVLAMRNDLPLNDRVAPIMDVFKSSPYAASELHLGTPDTNEGKELMALCRAIERPLKQSLVNAHCLQPSSSETIFHVCFLSASAAYIGYSSINNSAPWLMGIPRLKFPSQAPSRSTLKLEEAIHSFISKSQQEQFLRSGMRAVDLGAAPGGWTWQLVRRHMRVTAVDNGPLAQNIMDSGLVEHLRVDGFRYRPDNPVDWMVCDMVEQPIRIAELVARWLERGWCKRTIFNLKLPMKKRYQEVLRCFELIETRLSQVGIAHEVKCKQLYHDREEVTVYISCEP